MIKQITIIGLGLIGGSLGLALCKSRKISQVVGQDVDVFAIKTAVARGAVHWSTTSLSLAVKYSDIVVLAVPVGRMKNIVQEIIPYLKEGCIITDVGSTKEKLVEEISQILPHHIYFVGAHPMAGSERGGILGADPYLFENAIFCITPRENTHKIAVESVTALAGFVGAKVKLISPSEHDQMVAGVSHLPYLVAVSLVNSVCQLSQDYPGTLTLAAGGFRDTTRIAGGDPLMWKDISLSNQQAIIRMIDLFSANMEIIKRKIMDTCPEDLMQIFQESRTNREQIPFRYKGVLPEINELLVSVPDKTGMLALITGCLAEQGINVSEIEVLPVRENHEGAIRLGFQRKDILEKAEEILKSQGLKVQRR